MLDKVANSLFALLRLGIGVGSISDDKVSSLSSMTETDWELLKTLAEKQGVSALVLDGLHVIDKKHKGVSNAINEDWWKRFVLKWMGSTLVLEQTNRQQLAVMERLADVWIEAGCRMMVMKGQANALMCPNPLHRSPGDIDCYLFGDYAKENELVVKVGAEVNEGWYKHSEIKYLGETFENHLYFVHTREGKRSKRLQKELEEALNVTDWATMPNSKVLVPPVQWNAMFLTYHACAHFLTEGLRLKQVLDWALFLKQYQDEVDWGKFYEFCERYHLLRLAEVVTEICSEYLGIKITNKVITKKSPYTEKVLRSMLYDDDYIYGAGEGKWQSKLHILRSLFRYRWKYNEIYQQSVWKQLWWYVSGYVFHTE